MYCILKVYTYLSGMRNANEVKKGQTFTNGTSSVRFEMLNIENLLIKNLTTEKESYLKIDSLVYDVKYSEVKKAQFSTYNNCKVGDLIEFLEIPFYKDDLRLFYSKRIITKMELSKTGKRVIITYDNGFKTSDIGLNTYFQEGLTEKFMDEMTKERGWRD